MQDIQLILRKLKRERLARKQAEAILEQKAQELFKANDDLRKLNESLEHEVRLRTAELRESEIKYRSVMENMDLGLMEVDNNGIIVRVYDKFLEMTGYEEKEMIGKSANELLLLPEFRNVMNVQEKKRLKGQAEVYEVKIKDKWGNEKWVLISGAPFHNEKGNIIGSLGIHYDITDRKELEISLHEAKEEAQRAQKAEKEFLARMSHEIRTPLNSIIGMTHILNDSNLSDEQREHLDLLMNSAEILQNLVSDILDIAKIDAGKIEIHKSTFDLLLQAKLLIQTISIKNHLKPIEFTLEHNLQEEEFLILADKQILNQILLNLLGNAEKFTEQGFVKLAINVLPEGPGHYRLRFEISDSGRGMTSSELKAVFDQFSQANSSISRTYGGTGLGIPITSKLLELLGSKLEVFSESGKGSTFFFELVVEPGKPNEKMIISPKISSNLSFGHHNLKADILLVEDNEMNVRYITKLFDQWNVNYMIAENGKVAVDYSKQFHFDLIFMDLSMPVMNGYEASLAIRALEKNSYRKIPIIALTASTFVSKRELAKDAGMTDFLPKPFTPEQLKKIIVKYHSSSISHTDERSIPFLELLSQFYGNDPAYAYEMFDLFLKNISQEINHLKAIRLEKNIDELKRHLHKIKPGFLMVGLKNLHHRLDQLENSPSERPWQDLLDLEKDILSKLDDVEIGRNSFKKLIAIQNDQ